MVIEHIRKDFQEHGIKHVKVGGFDVDGVLRGKYISLEKFWSAVEKGFGFCDVIFGWDIADQLYDNATVTGWQSGYPDALAQIDLSTYRRPPFAPDTAHFLVDFYLPDKTPHPACPRNLLKQIVERAQSRGFRPRFSAEFEFWVFKEQPETLRAKRFNGLDPLSPGMFGYSWLREGQHRDFVHRVLDTMNSYGIAVEGLHTETGPGVWEACIHYDDAIRAADQAALFKTTLKEICHHEGLCVTFMAKWNAELPGSSGHLHQSLWDPSGDTNLFAGAPETSPPLSDLGRQYLAGLVRLSPELTALYAPFINSYKRYVPGMWAPMNASWGVENRTCGARVIGGLSDSAKRVEFRQTGADINPYIAMAACLGSGLYGIEQELELPQETSGDATQRISSKLALPTSLDEAVTRLQKSKPAREMLGDAFVDHYVRTRQWECREHRKSVSAWELERYFEAV